MGHPQLQSSVNSVFMGLLKGQRVVMDGVRILPKIFHHHISYPQAGQTTPFTFFQSTTSDGFQSNWNANGLSTNQAFGLWKIGFQFEPDAAVSSTSVMAYATAAAAYVTDLPTAVTLDVPPAVTDAQQHARLLRNLRVEAKVGTYQIVDEYGLQLFPPGFGANLEGAISNIGGPATNFVGGTGIANVNNGANFWGNGRSFDPLYPIYPQEIMSVRATGQTAIAFSTAGRLSCYAIGFMVEA